MYPKELLKYLQAFQEFFFGPNNKSTDHLSINNVTIVKK